MRGVIPRIAMWDLDTLSNIKYLVYDRCEDLPG